MAAAAAAAILKGETTLRRLLERIITVILFLGIGYVNFLGLTKYSYGNICKIVSCAIFSFALSMGYVFLINHIEELDDEIIRLKEDRNEDKEH